MLTISDEEKIFSHSFCFGLLKLVLEAKIIDVK